MKKTDHASEYVLYWAHLDKHTDPHTEGYIGITIDLEERKRAHNKNRANQKFARAIRDFGKKIKWKLLHQGLSMEEALSKEFEYRPVINIGWNSNIGGTLGVDSSWYEDHQNKQKHSEKTSEATKRQIAKKDTPESRSKRARAVWSNEVYRKSREGMFAGQNNPQYGKHGSDHPAAGHKKTEAGRAAISKAHRGKCVTEETRKKISDARIKRFAAQKALRLANEEEQLQKRKELRDKKRKAGAFKGENAPASKVSDTARAEICKRRAMKESYLKIAQDFPISLTGVRAIVQTWGPENGFPFKKVVAQSSHRQKLDAGQRNRICRAYIENRASMKQLAAKYSVGETTIYETIRSWGPKNGYIYDPDKKNR
jgi:hypothetical protein